MFGVCACRGGVTMQQTCAVADESDDTTIGAVIGRCECIAVIRHNSSIQ